MAKNLKGGYKIVSLNGLDLVGESLAIAGLYDKLAKSYDKPILVTGIVIDGEKKKNAFVQVEVLDDGIKINDLYGYDLLVEEDGDITVSANPHELPNTADASAGQVLKLDAQKKPVWGNEAELPDTADASQGNALLLDAEKKPVWGAIASGTKLYLHKITFSNSAQIDLITTDSESYSGYYSKVKDAVSDKKVVNVGDVKVWNSGTTPPAYSSVMFGIAIYYNAPHLDIYYVDNSNSNTITSVRVYSGTTTSDTVTEL